MIPMCDHFICIGFTSFTNFTIYHIYENMINAVKHDYTRKQILYQFLYTYVYVSLLKSVKYIPKFSYQYKESFLYYAA